MVNKHTRGSDGLYHVNGVSYKVLTAKGAGARAKVWHGTAYQTSGGLTKNDLIQNARGRIVSKKKNRTAKAEKRLERHGYFAQKGKFGYVKKTPRRTGSHSRKRSSKRKSRSKSRRPHTI